MTDEIRPLLPPGPGRDLGEPFDDAALAAAYAYPPAEAPDRPGGRPWVRANMVCTADGATAGPDGLSGTISGPADRRVFRLLRSLADVVLVGAGTVRAEGYRPAALPIAVVSGRLTVDLESPLVSQARFPTVLLTAQAAGDERLRAAAAVADVVVCGDERVDPVRALEALRDRGHANVLCEGGPTLLGAIAAAGLLDELCLTLSPLLTGSAGARGPLEGNALPHPLSLRPGHVLASGGTLLTRWLVDGAWTPDIDRE